MYVQAFIVVCLSGVADDDDGRGKLSFVRAVKDQCIHRDALLLVSVLSE